MKKIRSPLAILYQIYNSNKNLIKVKLKKDVQISGRPCNYDEIEEKLKQICDGCFEENNSNNMEKSQSVSNNQKEVLQQTSNRTPVHRSINYKHSPGNKIGHILTSNTEDIEIIFSAEDKKEDVYIHKCESHNNDVNNETGMLGSSRIAGSSNTSNNKKTQQNISVTPNIKAAMKRKRRTRDEIMKSIERSIRNMSFRGANSLTDSDTFEDIKPTKVGKHKKKLKKTQEPKIKNEASPVLTTTRFTVKVTGHPDDVSDIMFNLSKSSTGNTNLQEYKDVRSPKENDGFVTSVITIDDCPADVDDKVEFQDDSLSSCIKSITTNDQMLPSTSENCQCLSTEVPPHLDEELDDLNVNNSHSIPIVNDSTQLPTTDDIFKCEYEKLQQKLSVQMDIVRELSNQLILCKRTEAGLQNKNSSLEKKIQKITDELNSLSYDILSPPISVKEDSKQRLIDDLAHKVNYFDEANKRLVKVTTSATEKTKKLESQIRQKDNRIKELNWKVDKASKFIERAEKNTITYQKKLLNLQTVLKRKKLSEEKMTKLNEILIDIVKKNYIGKTLPINVAIGIKKVCGTTEYDKLLQSGFPLPTLPIVRIASDNLLDPNKSINKIPRATTSRHSSNMTYDTEETENHIEIDKNVELVVKEIMFDDSEVVTGTVQDIFENDDDLSTDELPVEFISHLI